MASNEREMLEKLMKTNQNDWKNAGPRLGFVVDVSRGKGSHALWLDPEEMRKYVIAPPVVTIARNLHKVAIKKMFNRLVERGCG